MASIKMVLVYVLTYKTVQRWAFLPTCVFWFSCCW